MFGISKIVLGIFEPLLHLPRRSRDSVIEHLPFRRGRPQNGAAPTECWPALGISAPGSSSASSSSDVGRPCYARHARLDGAPS